MNIFYLQSDSRRREQNEAGIDYTPAYIPAVLAWLGACGRPCCAGDLASLGEGDILLANTDDLDALPENAGAVILFGGGARREAVIRGHLLFGEERIPLFAPLRTAPVTGEVLYMGEDGAGNRIPAVVKHSGRVYEFRFDLCASVWFSGDGFSDGQGKNGFFIGRTPDTRPVPPGQYSHQPYNDHLLSILEDILLSLGVPLLWRLPLTEEGEIPDFALHISGDDDATSAEYNRNAAEVTNRLGLYYHINAMPKGDCFVFSPQQREEMAALGCELALHTDFTAQPYTSEGQRISAQLFREFFGIEPVTNVNHCLIQASGTAERLRWLEECGIIADNGKMGEMDPSDINAFNLCGFGFGTSFPRYTCDDAEHGNRMIGCMEIPLNYYEPRLGGAYTDEARIPGYIDGAAADGRIAQFFVHPHYFAPDNPHSAWSVAALERAKAHWTEKGYRVCLTSTNRIAAFWQARKNAAITADESGFTVECSVPAALVLPQGVTQITIDGKPAETVTRTVMGRTVTLAALGAAGLHHIGVQSSS